MNETSTRFSSRPTILATGLLTALAAVGTLVAAPPVPVALLTRGTYETGTFAEGGAEIVRYDPLTQRVFAVNAAAATVDILDVSNPDAPVKVNEIDVAATLANDPNFSGLVAGANGIAVNRGVLAVAVEADPKTDNGWAAFYSTETLELLGWANAGALPDMITFVDHGRLALVANEGEPNSYGEEDSVDPEGSITVIKVKTKKRKFPATTVDFSDFIGEEDALRAEGIRIFGPGANAAQDFEPEYIAVSPNGRNAYITLQENNAIAVLDLKALLISRVMPLGFKDHSLPGNGLDGSDRDGPGSTGAINIANWPVFGVYMPDSISVYRRKGVDYLVTANEGDSRQDWFEEESRIKDLVLDAVAFPDAATIQNDDGIGRLTVTTTLGDADGNGEFEALYAFGGRSFSIWDENGNQVFDSGDAFEQITAAANPGFFNSDHEVNNFDNRSDNKGPEPEGLALGKVRGRTYAFVGMERVGGIAVYDITIPTSPTFIEYVNTRDFGGDTEAGTAGDLGPEGLEFALVGPEGTPVLVVGSEVSGTTTLYDVGEAGNP